MAIPYQTISFLFGAAEQDTGSRQVKTGNLVIAENVRQVKRSQYRKRRGYARTAPTFSGASWTAPSDTVGLVPGPAQTLFTIDGAGVAWAYDPVATVWRSRGSILRVFPQHTAYLTSSGLEKPHCVVAGTQLWTFGLVASGSAYRYTVTDTTTGEIIQAETSVTAKVGSNPAIALAPVYDGTNVWVIWVTGVVGDAAKSHKFTTATPGTAPSEVTYRSAGVGNRSVFFAVDAMRLSGPGETAVVLGGGDTGGTKVYVEQSYLASNGAAKNSPAPVAAVDSANAWTIACVSILAEQTGSGTWYYAYQLFGQTVNNMDTRLVDVTTTTLATAATTTLEQKGSTPRLGICCGYVAVNGDRVVYQQMEVTTTCLPWNFTVRRHVRGSGSTDTTVARGAWLASKPVKIGSAFYLMTGYEDDGDTLSSSVQVRGLQRTFHLRDSDGNLVSQALSGQAAGLGHHSATPTTSLPTQGYGYSPAVATIGSVAVCAGLMLTGTLLDLNAGVVAWDFAATYGLPAACQGRALAPGGIPFVWGHQENVRELAPLVYPNYFTVSATATSYDCAVVYRFTSPDGTFWRSAPLRGTQSIANAATITIPTLRHLLPGTLCSIEFYAGSSGVPFLQQVKANDTTADTITMTFSSTLKTDEALYTTGGALSNAPPPPCKHVAVWQNRAFLAGTPERDTIWCSQEFAPGFGPQLNEVLTSTWRAGSDGITGLAANGLYLAVFRLDACAVLNGPGPDGRGSGNFVPQTLDEPRGCSNWRSFLRGDQGLFFQGVDGLVYMLTGTQVVDAFAGMQDYAGVTITAALLDQDEGNAVFFQADGVQLVLDYQHKTPDQPAGSWYHWTSANLNRAYGACVDSAGVSWHLESTGVLRKAQDALWTDAASGGTTPVLMKLKTGKLAPVGPQGFCRVARAPFYGQYVGACNLRMTLASGATSSTHDKAPIVDPLNLVAFPPALNRVQEVECTIEETSNAGGTEGFVFDGLGFDVQPLGYSRAPEAAERI